MALADKKSVHLSSFCPTPAEAAHWVSVVKAQVAKALKEYVDHLPGAPDRLKLPSLMTKPPPIDPIDMHLPNIHFLRMIDAPDSSAEGVSRVLDEVIRQIGLDKKKYAESLLVAGGDVGSNQLLKSLRQKRFPPIDSVEGIQWVLSIFGGAHTTWNFTKALLGHHWGKSDNGDDTGAWRSLFALGGEYKKPPATQDFNTIMRSARILHKANLVHIIRSASMYDTNWNACMYLPTLGNSRETFESNHELDLTKAKDCERLVYNNTACSVHDGMLTKPPFERP
ncbi:uncharacterized protein MELLADRAFT_64215 [Melampsora larici-populina 98AG31]|uniref:DUF6589 domain-containing protein n=1 Tax=Melampsora larici-populina (strain 98AG31 / pathotype 3-4-7) TaxID=747676 RepID=F4RQF4_MELLP|nr:uncharacterized protein MELLADRAFT_64215 [Melampsora larici-populina 98AG31]EGG05399.1 hypothetical protein MELLADRAFT_64215 [Melampsora larici-populina 98AG31]